MEKFIRNMENNIIINETSLPELLDCNILTASEDFYHMDRVAEFDVLIYVTSGSMYVTEGGEDFEIKSGELLFLKKGLRHFGKRETLRGTRWLYAHFVSENLDSGLVVPKKVAKLFDTKIQEDLFSLCELNHSEDKLKDFKKNVLLYEILLEIAEENCEIKENIVNKVCEFLSTQTDKNFSRKLVEGRFFLSYSRIAAQFKEQMGESMGDYHNELRMKKACRLLSSTLMSVGGIGEELGFSDKLYFSKKFREFKGMSPTEYRRKMRESY